jgi:uncharacterized protein involved in outer membrane biogenesis
MAGPPPRHRPRTLRIVLIGVAAVVLLGIIGVAAVVLTFDPNSYKPQIVAAVQSATGRQLTIKGNIGYSLSLRPTLDVSDVAIANPPGFSRPEMATLKTLQVQVALLPLLSRQVEIERLVLVQPSIVLETNARGQTNWTFAPAAPGAAPGAAPPSGPPAAAPPGAPAASASPPAVQLSSLRIEDGVLAMRDAAGQVTTLQLRRLNLTAPTPGSEVHLAADAAYNGLPLTITGDTGPPMRLQQPAVATPRWPVKLSIDAAGAHIGIDGSVAQPALGRGLALAVIAKVPNLAALTPLAGAPLPALKNVALHLRLADSADATGYTISDLTLTTPQLDLSGIVSYRDGNPPTITAELTSNRIDADALGAGMAPPKEAAPASQAGGAPAGPKTRPAGSRYLIPDTRLPLAGLRAFNSDVKLAVGELRLGKVDYRDLKLHEIDQQGQLTVEPIDVDAPGGHISAKLTVNSAVTPPRVALTLRAPRMALQPLLSAMGKPGAASGTAELRADLQGSGDTPRAIAASLSGAVGIAVANGEIDSRLLGSMVTDLLPRPELTKLVSKTGVSKLNCFATRLNAENGIGTFQALLLDSSTITMDGSGQVNFRNETLDMKLRPSAGVVGTNITVPLKVGGTFAAPSVEPDAAGVLTDNAGTAAKTALGATTGGLGLIIGSAIESKTAGDVCAGPLALARFGTAPAAPAPAAPARGTQAPPSRPKPENPLGGLKKLFQ